jgi:hypothetical protein
MRADTKSLSSKGDAIFGDAGVGGLGLQADPCTVAAPSMLSLHKILRWSGFFVIRAIPGATCVTKSIIIYIDFSLSLCL